MSDLPSDIRGALLRGAQGLTRFKRQHAVLAGGLVALAAGSMSAIALAVAPLVPDPAQLPQRQVIEDVRPLEIAPQLEALADPGQTYLRTWVQRQADAPAAVLRRAGVTEARVLARLGQDPQLIQAFKGRGPRTVELATGSNGQLQRLRVRRPTADADRASTHFDRLTAEVDAHGLWTVRQETVALAMTPSFASGTIRSSLFAATDDAGIPDAVATQLAEIFSGDVDFHRELRKGDRFSIVYEALTADGEPVPWDQGAGRILAAEFRNGTRVHQAFWFQPPGDDKGAYFDAQGNSRKRAFLASPVEFSRVTSGFSMRMHPILQQWRAHRGVDYAAPIGTAVRAVGDGVVEFAGWQGGYGKTVEIRHAQDRSTVYAHLSRIDVKVGERITQGRTVGAVGTTGLSTGPHLHFEFRVAGVHQDPLKLARQAEVLPLPTASIERFARTASQMQVKLEWAASLAAEPGTIRFE